MQSVSASLLSRHVSLAPEPENLSCYSSFLRSHEGLLEGRQHMGSTFHGWLLEANPFRAKMNDLFRRRKSFRVRVSHEPYSERFRIKRQIVAQLMSNVAIDHDEISLSSEQRVYNVIIKQAALIGRPSKRKSVASDRLDSIPVTTKNLLEEAYKRCGEVCAEYAKTFYLGTLLMTQDRRKAIWAIYVWCRRTDELVDGPNASQITPTALDRWEQRLEKAFEGQPYDMLDAALSETVMKFPVDIQPFRDMITGMRMDLFKTRYLNFDELYLYCYYVAGTVGLMSVPVMGIDPLSKASAESVYNAALSLGIANQLTNILRDVGEDASRGRIYLPQDELEQFGLSDDDIFAGIVTDKWRAFMMNQIKRARIFFKQAERGVMELDKDSRWPVWASLLLYEQILDSIEANDYNNFTRRAYVGKLKKVATIPIAYFRALIPPPVPRLAAAG